MARDPYRRHTRRIRRAMRKNGNNPYGVLIIGPDEPFGLIIAAALGRWAFRHRSAFYPFWVALASFIAASAAHGHHAKWWIPATAVTAVATIIIAFPLKVMRRHPAGRRIARVLSWAWEKCGIGRPVERGYTAAVIATAGGWLAAAIANGPTVKPAADDSAYRDGHSRGPVVVPPPAPRESPHRAHHIRLVRCRG
jgi:hypothetical protein